MLSTHVSTHVYTHVFTHKLYLLSTFSHIDKQYNGVINIFIAENFYKFFWKT